MPGKYIHGGQGTGENEECGSYFFRDRLERGISLFRDSGNYLIIKSIFLFVKFKTFLPYFPRQNSQLQKIKYINLRIF